MDCSFIVVSPDEFRMVADLYRDCWWPGGKGIDLDGLDDTGDCCAPFDSPFDRERFEAGVRAILGDRMPDLCSPWFGLGQAERDENNSWSITVTYYIVVAASPWPKDGYPSVIVEREAEGTWRDRPPLL